MNDRLYYGSLCSLSLLSAAAAKHDWLWIDERITIELVERWTFVELLTILPVFQPHYPTYYLIPELFGWYLTIILSVAALPITVYATMRTAIAIHDKQTAFGAGFLVAISPFLATQATWIRMYSILTALMAIGLWLAIEQKYNKSALSLFVAAILHPFGWFGVLWLSIISDWKYRWSYLVAGSIPVASLIWVNSDTNGVTQLSTGVGHAIKPSIIEMTLIPVTSLVGSQRYLAAVVLALVMTAVVAYPTDRRLLYWIVIPIIGLVAASYLIHPVFRLKYFGFIAPAVAIAIVNPNRSRQTMIIVGSGLGGLMMMSWLTRSVGAIISRRLIFWFEPPAWLTILAIVIIVISAALVLRPTFLHDL